MFLPLFSQNDKITVRILEKKNNKRRNLIKEINENDQAHGE